MTLNNLKCYRPQSNGTCKISTKIYTKYIPNVFDDNNNAVFSLSELSYQQQCTITFQTHYLLGYSLF